MISWYVVYPHPHAETKVASRSRRQVFACCLPLFRKTWCHVGRLGNCMTSAISSLPPRRDWSHRSALAGGLKSTLGVFDLLHQGKQFEAQCRQGE